MMEAALTIVAKYVPAMGMMPRDFPATIQSFWLLIPREIMMPMMAKTTMNTMTVIR